MAETATASQHPSGIGGWLVLPMLGTIISPILTAVALFQNIDVFMRLGDKQTVIWKYFVIGEMIVMAALIAGWIVTALKLFQHKRVYPKLFVLMLAATFVYNLLDTITAMQMFNQAFDASAVRDVGRPIVALIVWGPYMYLSKRVKNTFVY
jgi:small-conductance mechanosensitive channel